MFTLRKISNIIQGNSVFHLVAVTLISEKTPETINIVEGNRQTWLNIM